VAPIVEISELCTGLGVFIANTFDEVLPPQHGQVVRVRQALHELVEMRDLPLTELGRFRPDCDDASGGGVVVRLTDPASNVALAAGSPVFISFVSAETVLGQN
jgi:hypothetical protein